MATKFHPLTGEAKVYEPALAQMRKSGFLRWAAYQNVDLSSPDVGALRFLAVGPGRTFEEPPERMPDSPQGLGWRYMLVGYVNLDTGEVISEN